MPPVVQAPTITSLTVTTDETEYCRFERQKTSRYPRGRHVVTAYVVPTPNDQTIVGQTITVAMVKARRDRTQVVATTTHTFNGPVAAPGASVTFDLSTAVVDTTSHVNPFRRGDYFVRATNEDGRTVGESDDFRITLLTVARLQRDFLLGSTTKANDIRMVRQQPSLIPGVFVIEVSPHHPLDVFPLNYRVVGSQQLLSWRDGAEVTLNGKPDQIVELVARDRRSFIVVQVHEPWRLPTAAVREELFIDLDILSEDTLKRYIDASADEVENELLGVFLEPTLVTSDSRWSYTYDALRQGTPYYPPTAARWIQFQLPMQFVQKVNWLRGCINDQQVIDIQPSWIEVTPQTGFVRLMPYSQAQQLNYVSLLSIQTMRATCEIPNFWQYEVWAGLRDTPDAMLRLIGMHAAIPILLVVGQMYRGGFASQSISRDGVSESVSYTSSAMYGVYSATIDGYNKEIEKQVASFKGKYRGLVMHVC